MIKDSFLIYTSFYKPISRLSDKQLGRLFRAIFKYHIDGAVTVQEDIEMAFAFFANQFEIDESKYLSKVERNRESGRKGGMAKVNRGRPESQPGDRDGGKIKRALEKSSESSERLKNKQTPKTLSYNDNDNDNDNESSSTTTRVCAREADVGADDRMLEEFFKDQAAIEAFCRDNGISSEQLRRTAAAVLTEWKLTGHAHESETDARRHLLSQIRIKLKYSDNDTDTSDRRSRRRGADSAAVSPEDFTGTL